jgi:hypothetical protein
MLYAILAYHVEADVMSWTPEEDATVMTDLLKVHDRINQAGRLGPAARLGATMKARTLRGPGAGLVLDGPFAETKEQLLGSTSWTAPPKKPPSRLPATCAAPILPRSMRSAHRPLSSRVPFRGRRLRADDASDPKQRR